MSNEQEQPELELGTVSYGETRTINVGNYESIKTELRYHSRVKPVNNKEFLIETNHTEIKRMLEGEVFNDAVKVVVGRVKKVLDMRETDIRMRSAKFVDDFLPEEKVLLNKLIGLNGWRNKTKKFAVEQEEIKDFFREGDNGFEDEVEI